MTCLFLQFQSRSDKRRSGDEQQIAYEHSDDYRPKPYYYSGQLEYEISKRVRVPRKLKRERAKAELDSERLSEKLDEKARRKLSEKSRRNNNSIRRNGSQVKRIRGEVSRLVRLSDRNDQTYTRRRNVVKRPRPQRTNRKHPKISVTKVDTKPASSRRRWGQRKNKKVPSNRDKLSGQTNTNRAQPISAKPPLVVHSSFQISNPEPVSYASPSRQKFEETRYEVSQQSVPTRSYPLQPYSDEFDPLPESKPFFSQSTLSTKSSQSTYQESPSTYGTNEHESRELLSYETFTPPKSRVHVETFDTLYPEVSDTRGHYQKATETSYSNPNPSLINPFPFFHDLDTDNFEEESPGHYRLGSADSTTDYKGFAYHSFF